MATTVPATVGAPTTSTAASQPAGWTVLDPGPLSPRYGETQVWTGSELLVWGGKTPGVGEPLDDGAAYEPVTGLWRMLPTSNGLALRGSGVWTGTELVVVNEQSVSALDPATGQWRRLFSASVGGDGVERVILDGSRLLVLTENRSDGAYSLWINEMPTGAWRTIRTDLVTDPDYLLWTGRHLIDAYGRDATGESDGVVVWIYDVATDFWSTSPGPPIDNGRGIFSALGPDGQVFVWGDPLYNPEDEEMGVPYDHGLAFDPVSAEWTEIPMIETSWWECSTNSAVAGPLVYVETCLDKVWFDPAAATLTGIDWPEPVAGVDTYPAVTPVWTGAELLFWGQPFCYACEEILLPRLASIVPPTTA